MLYQGLPANARLSERLPRRFNPNHKDVFACVKHELADEDWMQDPLLTLPGDEEMEIQQFWLRALGHVGTKTHLSPDRCEALKELADALSGYPQYERACAYMRSIAGATSYPRRDAWPLEFLRDAAVHAERLVIANLPPREERPRAHELQVHFHHLRRG